MARQDVIIRMRLAGEEFDREFKAKFDDIEQEAERRSSSSGAKSGGGFAKGFLGAAGLGALGAAIGTAISSSADLGAEIASTSRQFNIGAEQLQIWRQAASNAGVSAADFTGSLGTLTQKIGEANAGNRSTQQAFVDLGVGFKTAAGEARATDAVMLDLAKSIAAMEDPSERARVGAALFGDEWKNLHPLLLQGADGLSAATTEMERFGGVLTQEELKNLNKLNSDIQDMKDQLSRSIAKVVGDNADSISNLADQLGNFAAKAIDAANAQIQFAKAMQAYDTGKASGASEQDLIRQTGVRSRRPRGVGEWLYHMGQDVKEYQPYGNFDDRSYVTDYGKQRLAWWMRPDVVTEGVANPSVDPKLARAGGRARTRNPTETAAKSEGDRAAKEAIRNEDQLRDAIARTLREQNDSAAIQRIRTEQGEKAAAIAEAELRLVSRIPGVQAQTVDELGKALGYTDQMIEKRRQELGLQLASNKAAIEGAKTAAGSKADAENDREKADQAKRNKDISDRAAADWERAHEIAIGNVADLYETAFQGGTKDIWRTFKDEGIRMIAELAAQWTLAQIGGQPFNFNSAASGALGRSPLASIFGGIGGGAGAANDNGFVSTFANSPLMRGGGGIAGAATRTALGGGGAGGLSGGLAGIGGAVPQIGAFLAATQVSDMIGSGLADVLGVEYSKTGGSLFGAVGGLVGGLLKGTKRGSVTVGNRGGTLGITGSQGNSKAREATASQGAGSLIDAIFQIADQLGGGVDASRGSVSFGMRKDSFRVDPSGRGVTKIGNGAIDFGSDQEAAMRFAIGDLIKDGVITGISQASQNLISKGGDLDKQIEKALLLEQIPKLLRQRTDPLGAAIDDLADKFKRVNEALIEGSASAEQFAQARQLWELEKADAIASVGAASQSLKDFLAALNAGSSSPLSLREQRAEAEAQLKPFLTQISAAETARAEADRLRASGASAADIERAEATARAAAGAINQDGFTQASQLLLSISRQGNASSGAYFSDFDRVRALTGQAIGFVDQASVQGGGNQDPFGRETAQNTKDAAIILSEQAAEIRAQGETLREIAASLSGGGGRRFIGAPRSFVNAV